MFKGSLIKLIFGALILVFSYALPFFLVPIGSYSYSSDNITQSYSFQWNGDVKGTVKMGDSSTSLKANYKIKDREIYCDTDEEVKITKLTKLGKLKNIYTIEIGDNDYKNYWALGFTVIGFALTAWGIIGLCIPKKKRR